MLSLALAMALLGCAGKPAPLTAAELHGYTEKSWQNPWLGRSS